MCFWSVAAVTRTVLNKLMTESLPIVVQARHLHGHILEIHFSDGHISVVDFAPFIFACDHPDIHCYRQPGPFLAFELCDGNLNWHDYRMIFPLEDLYHNRLAGRH